jgi:hypothetical protein
MSAWFRQALRTPTTRTVLASSILATALWVDPAAADSLQAFTAVLNGAQETPPNMSPSTGVAFLTFNKTNSNLCYAISYTPLGGTELVAHFHSEAPGQAGPVVKDISPSPSPLGSPKQGCVVLDKPQAKDLNKGLFYINVHSTPSACCPNATAGEIRGQVLIQKGSKYKTDAIASPNGAFLD